MICHIFARAAICEKRHQVSCRHGGLSGRGAPTGHAAYDLDGRQRPARSPPPLPPPQPTPQPRQGSLPELRRSPRRNPAKALPDKAPPRPFPWLGATQKAFLKKVLSLALPKDVSEKGITFNSFFRNVLCMSWNVMRSLRSRWPGQTRRYRSKPALEPST